MWHKKSEMILSEFTEYNEYYSGINIPAFSVHFKILLYQITVSPK